MKNKYTDEDLLMALPDYVRGADVGNELEALLREKIETDASFKEEYEAMFKTFNFLSKAEFSEPPDHYFTNLQIRINDRIPSTNKESWWERLSIGWKVLIPAIPVIIALMIFFFNKDDRQEKIIALDTGKKMESVNPQSETAVQQNTPDTIFEKISDAIDTSDEAKTYTSSQFNVETKKHFSQENNIDTEQLVSTTLLESSLADNIEDNGNESIDETGLLLGTEETEQPVEDEFLELSPEDQSEILEILKNS
ncbi:MAG: hypothetical protein WBC65_14045 [Ignavibacteria bacterium]